MGAIIDLIIVFIIGVTLFFAVKNGFVKTALGALGFFIAAAVALAFCGPLGGALADGGFGDRVEAVVDSTVDKVVNAENYKGVFENDGEDENEKPSALSVLFTSFGASDAYTSLSDGYNAQVEKGLENAREYIKNGINEKAVPFCCDILAFLLIYFGMRLLIKIAEVVMGKLTELPVLKQADKLLGALMGVLLAVLRVSLFCVALKLLIPISGALGIDWLAQIDLNDSMLYSIFEGGNLLSALI